MNIKEDVLRKRYFLKDEDGEVIEDQAEEGDPRL